MDACLEMAANVTGDWSYSAPKQGEDACKNIRNRLKPPREDDRRVPRKLKMLADVLDPQPDTAAVLHQLIQWIDRADEAAQRQEPQPAFCNPDGSPIFPASEWWLTDIERRTEQGAIEQQEERRKWDDDEMNVPAPSSTEGSESDAYASDASLPPGPPLRKTQRKGILQRSFVRCEKRGEADSKEISPLNSSTALDGVARDGPKRRRRMYKQAESHNKTVFPLDSCAQSGDGAQGGDNISAAPNATTRIAAVHVGCQAQQTVRASKISLQAALHADASQLVSRATFQAADVIVLPVSDMRDMPADMRRRAKRGGDDVELV